MKMRLVMWIGAVVLFGLTARAQCVLFAVGGVVLGVGSFLMKGVDNKYTFM